MTGPQIKLKVDVDNSADMLECNRLRDVYAERQVSASAYKYSLFDPAHLLNTQELERALLFALKAAKGAVLANQKILDVGCGTGEMLTEFIRFGARASGLSGIDLLEERISKARGNNPAINYQVGDGSSLPFADEEFDIVSQFVVFSSISTPELRLKLAQEMLRVTKPDGCVLWYDFFVPNPRNPNVWAMPRREIERLFPNCRLDVRKVTLAPPLARLIAPISLALANLLLRVPLLKTHYLVLITKN